MAQDTRETTSDSRRTSSSNWKWGLGVVALIAVAAAAWFALTSWGKVEAANAEVIGPQQSISGPGGAVAEVLVEEGQPVKEGDVVLRMDDRGAKQRAEVAKQAIKEAQAAHHAAATELEAADDASREAKQTALQEAEEKLAEAQQMLVRAEQAIDSCLVRAPADGAIGKIYVGPGESLMGGAPLMTLVDSTATWIVANFENTQLKDVKEGQRAIITSSAYPFRRFLGKVVQIGKEGDPADIATAQTTPDGVPIIRDVQVRIVIPDEHRDAERPLTPGMEVSAKIDVRS